MRKIISSAAIIAGVLMVAQASQAATVEERLEALEQKLEGTDGGNFLKAAKKKVDVTLYGQVNKAVLFADDGEDDDVFFLDNDISGTRFGIKAKAKINDEFSAGAQLEAEWQQNSSNKVDMNTQSSDEDAKKRQMKVYLQSKTAGKLTLGHGSTASDGIAEIDISGTKIAGSSHMKAQGGNFKFWDDDNDAYTGGITVGSIFDHLDGGSRKDGLRYDSPTFFGVTISGGVAEDNFNDLAIRYANNFSGTKVSAGLGYTYAGAGSSTHNTLSGSASVMLPFGLSFTVAAGEKEFDDQGSSAANYDDGSYIYGKVGYQLKAFSLGSTSFSVDYGEYDDMKAGNSLTAQYEGSTYGLQFVQKADAINTEFYLAYRLYELDDNVIGTDYDDLTLIWSGARFKF
ncbi:MAG: hypothetical protein C0613_08705 [Desulfobulbaceae bacterium]|nr:MAG: hypothetical protein C0613_08705 [Desulfobulbaceae bacterium]